ncbi:MAG: HNH endonuclease [Lachnospiraceae bacterium]|nr:HNH endonuclease [Lachnospiraceae bacterium]
MNPCSYPGCECPGHKHHIVFRSHGGLDNDLNLIDLCPEHHEFGVDAPHKSRQADVRLKQELQEKYYEVFEDKQYGVDEIAELIGISFNKTYKAFLKVPNNAGMYAREDIIRRLMGGRLY